MPIYEYACKKCGWHFEKMQNISDAPLAKCEECGGKLEKQWSLSGFQFKGEGWYVTDYSSKKGEKSGKSAEKGEKADKPGTSESTPAASSASNTQAKTVKSDKKAENG
jgi:putative FmdB family regulatory protein